MVAIPATTTKVKEEQNADGSITVDKRARPQHTVAIELLNDSDSDVISECDVKTKE